LEEFYYYWRDWRNRGGEWGRGGGRVRDPLRELKNFADLKGGQLSAVGVEREEISTPSLSLQSAHF
jgi:hypothetical protein